MLLAIDIGNSNIVIGVFDGNSLAQHWRIETVLKRTDDEYFSILQRFWQDAGFATPKFKQTIISSVVPQLTSTFYKMLSEKMAHPPIVVSNKINLGIVLQTYPPENTGADLIANAVAAYQRFNSNCIIVDFGTATTVMFVKSPGIFLGGAITAGLNTTLDALTSKTAQLPSVAITAPPSVIGNNSVDAIQSGLVLGHMSLVEGLVARMQKEMGACPVIATGGLAVKLAPIAQCIDHIDPWLTLTGLRIIAERNC